MNKQEAIETIEKMGEYEHFVDEPISKKSVLNIINQIDEPKKVVIPKFVEDYIETCKLSEFSIFDAMDSINLSNPKEFLVDNWFSEDEKIHQELFARAWLDGYEVEKEKLYWVRKNSEHSLLLKDSQGIISENSGWSVEHQIGNKDKFAFTEKEIKGYDERYWAFAVPVEVE